MRVHRNLRVVRRLRARLGWTVNRLSFESGVTPTTITSVECGRPTTWEKTYKIITALGYEFHLRKAGAAVKDAGRGPQTDQKELHMEEVEE